MNLRFVSLLLILFLCDHCLRASVVEGLDENCSVSDDGEVVCTQKDSSTKISLNNDIDNDDVVETQKYSSTKKSLDNDSNNNDASEDDADEDDFDDDDVDFDDEDDVQEEDVNCKNNHDLCGFWASKGECDANPNYMLNNCKQACNNCSSDRIKNYAKAQAREEEFLLKEVEKYGVHQNVESNMKQMTMLVIRKSINYMKNFVHTENPTHRLSKEVISICRNHDSLCAFWAASGECENNISFMTTKCAPSCQSCANIDFDTRCPNRSDDAKPGLAPGEMNVMFQNIVNNAPGNQTAETQLLAQEKKVQENGTPFYTVNVLSRPKSPTVMADETDAFSFDKNRDLTEDPWVVTFDNFLTEEECDHLIQLGYKSEYKRSKDIGGKLSDGSYDSVESTGRTSENAWCDERSGCRSDPIAARIMDRISNITKINAENFEDYQILKYEEGQFYREHHDFIEHQVDRPCGPRILTFFLYLNDVEEGGGTGLRIGHGEDKYMVVSPKKGKALLWPSALNFDPLAKDGRTRHEAIAVEKGTKFGANVWIHLFDVVETQRKGCT